jgi:endo-1,4-beta-xylanase
MNLRKVLLAFALSTVMIAITFIGAPFAQAAEEVELFNDEFEASSDGWSNLGSSTVSLVSDESHGGLHSCFVTNRTSSWHGVACSKSDVMKAGNTYNLSAYIMYKAGGDTEDFKFQLKYNDASAVAHYVNIATVTATKGEWTKIANTAYTIPSEATDVTLYFETPTNIIDFYIDSVSATGISTWDTTGLSITPLKNVFSNYFKIGCAATPSEISSQISKDIVKHHFNSLTLGNELKPDYVLDKTACQASGNNINPQVSLDNARSVLQFCADNKISVRGHVLLWHSQTPSWFFKENFNDDGELVSKAIMSQRLENYIKNLMDKINIEFPTVDFYAWDVVNEVFLNDGTLRVGGLNASSGESAWTKIYGDDSYIDEAFTLARKYAPTGCKLFYNDFNEYIATKSSAICTMASRLKNKGIIDGIGLQSHLSVSYPSVSLYSDCLKKYSELGLEIQITELDVTQSDQSAAGIKLQVDQYTNIMKSIIDAKKSGANITSVVFWGITDGTSWRKDGYPLLFDANYKPKDVLYSIVNLIDKSEYEISPYPLGDVNNDGQINIFDIVIVKKGTMNGFTDPAAELAADVNSDGNVNIFDFILMKKYIAGTINEF